MLARRCVESSTQSILINQTNVPAQSNKTGTFTPVTFSNSAFRNG